MWLRWVVSNFLQQVADRQIRQAMTKAKGAMDGHHAPDAAAIPREAQEAARQQCDIAVLFALDLESGGLLDRMEHVITTKCASFVEHLGKLDGRWIVVAETGVGQEAAGRAAEDLIEIVHPKWIVTAGFAGSLDQRLRPGHVLMANSVVDERQEELTVGFQIEPQLVAQNPALHVGRLLTIDELVRDPERKRELGREHGAVACDMETMAIARACHSQHVRFLSVRVVSDGVDDRIPPEVECLLDQPSLAGKLGAAASALFQRPQSLKGVWQLRERALRAADRLGTFLAGVIPQLTE